MYPKGRSAVLVPVLLVSLLTACGEDLVDTRGSDYFLIHVTLVNINPRVIDRLELDILQNRNSGDAEIFQGLQGTSGTFLGVSYSASVSDLDADGFKDLRFDFQGSPATADSSFTLPVVHSRWAGARDTTGWPATPPFRLRLHLLRAGVEIALGILDVPPRTLFVGLDRAGKPVTVYLVVACPGGFSAACQDPDAGVPTRTGASGMLSPLQ